MSSSPDSVRSPAPSRVAWTVCALDLVLLAAVLVLGMFTFFVTPFVGTPLSAAIAAPIGALVVSRRSGSRSGWLLLMFATAVALAVAFLQTALFAVERGIGELATAQALIAAGEVCFVLILLTLPLLLLTFPDGRLPSPRWRPVVGLLIALVVSGAVVSVLFAGNVTDPAAYIVSLDFGGGEGAVVSEFVEISDVVFGVLFLVVLVASAGSLLVRLRGAVGEERQQLKWVVYTGIVALVLFPMDLVRSSSTLVWTVQQVLAAAGAWLLPVGFGVALFKYKLWDIDVVIRRSVVYGVLWLGIAGAYVGVAAALGLVAGTQFPIEAAIGLTAVATVVFQPARHWLEQAADRWVFGRTSTPLQAVHGFGELVGDADRPGDIATQLAQTAAAATGLAWIEVDLDQSAPARIGTPNSAALTVIPIARGDERFGAMTCRPYPGRRLSERDEELLVALATQAGLAVSHARLARRIVEAQEVERRRIERNIHDGAQQELATLVARVGLARTQVNGDGSAERVLADVQREVQQILASLRELAQGIHPSVLRDGGITAVVEDRCSRLPIKVNLHVVPALRTQRFSDDIEGAAYFFVSEALTNVLKHSKSDDVDVRLGISGGELLVEVTDSGIGFDPDVGWGGG